MAVELRVSALGRPLRISERQPLRRMGQASERARQGGHRHEAAKKGGGHLASGQGAESQRDGAGEHAGQDFAHGRLLQTPFLHGGLRGQRPFRLEHGQGILVESRLCGGENILGAALCRVEVNQDVFGDRRSRGPNGLAGKPPAARRSRRPRRISAGGRGNRCARAPEARGRSGKPSLCRA